MEGLELERRDERMKEWRDGHNDEEQERRTEKRREKGGREAGCEAEESWQRRETSAQRERKKKMKGTR